MRSLTLNPTDALPPSPEAWLHALGGPALIRVPGRDRTRTRAVVTLLHGDEPSGLRAVHDRLRQRRPPAVDVAIFIGAVEAALAGPGFAHRALPGQRDLNRCFVPPCAGEGPALARDLLDLLEACRPEALVDLHNTSGKTPPYGMGPSVEPSLLALTSLFAPRFIHSDVQIGALVEATRPICPGVVVECGRAGDPAADAVARQGLDRYLDATDPFQPPGATVVVFEQPVRVGVAPGTRLAYGAGPRPETDLCLREDLDSLNFAALPPGTPLGWSPTEAPWPLVAVGASGRDLSHELFERRGGHLLTRSEVVPVMATTRVAAALGDCVFYAVRPRRWESAAPLGKGG